jgi:hypothetical protein
MEAAIGFEPMNEGFADLCLSHLATPPDQGPECREQRKDNRLMNFAFVCVLMVCILLSVILWSGWRDSNP